MNKELALQLKSFIDRFQQEKPLYTIQTKPLTMLPYNYGDAIRDFQNFLYENKLVRSDCYEIEAEFCKNYKDANWLNNLSEMQLMQSISFIIRRDRFVDGFIAQNINNGTIATLLKRLGTLYNL